MTANRRSINARAAKLGVILAGAGMTIGAESKSQPQDARTAPGRPKRSTGAPPNIPGDPGASTGRQVLWLMLDLRAVAQLSPNARAQSHWPRTNARTRIMHHTTVAARVQGLRRVREPVRITFRWIFPDRRKRDIDNLAGNGTVKAVLDALVADEYLADDSTAHVVAVNTTVAYETGNRWLEVLIEPAPLEDVR